MTGSQQLRDFQPTTTEGDPGKLAYLHNADWTPKPFVHGFAVDPRACAGCIFPTSQHVYDSRCKLWRDSHTEDCIS
jgi:hypothetical protein